MSLPRADHERPATSRCEDSRDSTRFESDAAFAISEHVSFQAVGDETVLLDFRSERYFVLNSTGSRIWEMLRASDSVGSIEAALLWEYDAAPKSVANDLQALLGELLHQELIVRQL